MKNIALIKSIVATSISSANPAELTEHIAALIQAHPEETRENALAILTGTARPRYTYQEPLKLQNVDKVTEEDRALMDVARDMWAGRTQRVADEIASIEAISHNTVKALSTVTTPLNVIVEMYIAGLEAKLQALRALVK